MRRFAEFRSLLLPVTLLVLVCFTQAATAQQELTPFEQLAVTALFGGKPLHTLTLTGSATWTAGSLQENGTVSLAAAPDGSVTETWTLPTQSHTRTETGFANGRSCAYTDKGGKQHQDTGTTCVQPVSWFAPWVALNLLESGNLIGASDATQASDAASGLVKLRFATLFNSAPGATTQAQLAELSKQTAVDVTFDLKTALPSSLTYNYMIDNDPRHVIEYAIVFADYRPEQGFLVPHHIQRYIQRTLQADITITGVAAN